MLETTLIEYILGALNTKVDVRPVLLIDFTTNYSNADNKYFFYSKNSLDTGYHLGIYRIYCYLTKYSIPTKIIRFNDYKGKIKELSKLVEMSEIIGVNALSSLAYISYKFCVAVKSKFPDKIIIGGAEHYALDYEWILNNQVSTGCDICCTMQGELPMLALALKIPFYMIGSIAYLNSTKIERNESYPPLSDVSNLDILLPVPVTKINKSTLGTPFPEFKPFFNHMGLTQTSAGCIYNCDFCTNDHFLGTKISNTLVTASQEIKYFQRYNINFVFLTNPLLNSSARHLNDFLNIMTEINQNRMMHWACFYSIRMENDLMPFKKMADTGCLMINVGIEDIVGNRALLKKGAANKDVIIFIEKAKEYLLIRGLLIIGLPNHYKYSRDELKDIFLDFMFKYPQGIYRINHFTPLFGTNDFEKYKECIELDYRQTIESLHLFDTMNPLIDPKKMYDLLNVPFEKRWIKKASDWVDLCNEITETYLKSEIHDKFIKSLKKNKLLYSVAKNYRDMVLKSL